jgi:hypothetical protein
MRELTFRYVLTAPFVLSDMSEVLRTPRQVNQGGISVVVAVFFTVPYRD